MQRAVELLPWHRRSSYEPDAPARGVPQSPRWRVGLVCARMRNFLAGVIPQGEGFRREERDERPAPGCTVSVSGSCAESLTLNNFPNDGRDPQMGDGQVNGPTLGFWPERDDDLLDLRQAGRGREENRNLVVAATGIGEVAEDLGRDQAGSGRGAACRFQGDDGLVDRNGRAIAKGQHTA